MLAFCAAASAPGQEARWVTQSTDLYPSVSPDGKRLVFHSNRLGRNQLFLADLDGRNLRHLASDDARITPMWSPDGERIAYVAFVAGQLDVFVMSADGSGARRLTDHAGADIHPHWSADGTRIFFNSDRS